ncbi:MAG: PIN domain-containing protein [Candidatus Micrarchaeaceae archaeon]
MERRDVESMIIVDANIFIFGETELAPEHEMAILKYKRACESDRIGTNAIILSEVFHFSRKISGLGGAAYRVENILNSSFVDFLDFTPESMIKAVKLARDFQMRINDALIAQHAIQNDASILTDNVKDFKKIKSIKIIPLRN